jgi:hypothetical protein
MDMPKPLDPSLAFEERKKELRRSKNVWRNWFVLSILLLIGMVLASFWFLGHGAPFLWLQPALALPLIYSAIFFHAQHNREREFLEEYSFKSVIARSLGAYRLILKEDVDRMKPEEQKRFLDLMVEAIRELHTPPRAIISNHPIRSEEDVKIGVIEKLADVFKRFIP